MPQQVQTPPQISNQQPGVQDQNTSPVIKKQFKSFWPIVAIATLSALVGGLIVWVAFNQGLDDQLNSLLPGSARVLIHKDKTRGGALRPQGYGGQGDYFPNGQQPGDSMASTTQAGL